MPIGASPPRAAAVCVESRRLIPAAGIVEVMKISADSSARTGGNAKCATM
jgi:hypothetical protein